MLYHLLYPFHTQLSVLNVTRYITFRTRGRELVGARHQPGARPVDDSQAARVSDRAGDPAGGADDAPAESRARRPWAGC